MSQPAWRKAALEKLHQHSVALKKDPLLGPVVRRTGPVRLNTHGDPFHSLSRAIVSQQISMKAAETIYGRLLGAVGGEKKLTPTSVLELGDAQLRPLGLSQQKIRYLLALSERVETGALPIRKLHRMDDEEVSHLLVQTPGIGEWTAQMFLMFFLAREDVWPVGDLGMCEALGRLHGIERPTAREARAMGEPWLGRRSVAAWYLWRSLEGEPQEGGIW